jgi:hypothetical protein
MYIPDTLYCMYIPDTLYCMYIPDTYSIDLRMSFTATYVPKLLPQQK